MPAKRTDLWTKAQDDYLRQWYGKRTPAEIGIEVGRKRGSVIGRAHRLGLSDKRKSRSPWKSHLRAPSPPKRSLAMPHIPIPHPKTSQPPQVLPTDCWQPLPGTTPVALVALEASDCRWPVFGGFCGCCKLENRPYCSTHNAIACRGTAAVLREIVADSKTTAARA